MHDLVPACWHRYIKIDIQVLPLSEHRNCARCGPLRQIGTESVHTWAFILGEPTAIHSSQSQTSWLLFQRADQARGEIRESLNRELYGHALQQECVDPDSFPSTWTRGWLHRPLQRIKWHVHHEVISKCSQQIEHDLANVVYCDTDTDTSSGFQM